MNLIKSIFILLLLAACKPAHVYTNKTWTYTTHKCIAKQYNDTLYLLLENALKCPIRYYVTSSDKAFNKHIKNLQPITLKKQHDTIIKIVNHQNIINSLIINSLFGDINRKNTLKKISLPFPDERKYKIMQGYNGSYSHNNDYSKYAIDFNLKVNDTVCAAANGVVVGVIKNYRSGGPDKKWIDYANYITIYHPETGLFTQYVHLKYNSSFVNVGDTVSTGQPIGISGKTGWVKGAHLHFNTLVPVDNKDGLKSIPIEFTEGYTGMDFKVNDVVEKP